MKRLIVFFRSGRGETGDKGKARAPAPPAPGSDSPWEVAASKDHLAIKLRVASKLGSEVAVTALTRLYPDGDCEKILERYRKAGYSGDSMYDHAASDICAEFIESTIGQMAFMSMKRAAAVDRNDGGGPESSEEDPGAAYPSADGMDVEVLTLDEEEILKFYEDQEGGDEEG